MNVSVITVSLNPGPALNRTVTSVLAQTYPRLEWIVVDGGSSDGSLEVFRDHADSISVLISEPDNGIADAMNKGLAVATGTAILFMHAGDTFDNRNSLSELVGAWDRDGYEWATAGAAVLSERGELLYQRDVSTLPSRHLALESNRICHPSTIVKRSLFERFGGFDTSFRSSMDYELWLRFISDGIFPQQLSLVVAKFYVGGTSANNRRRYEEDLRARRMHGLQNPSLAEWRLRMMAELKHHFGSLRRYPLAYRLKEMLRL